MLTTRKEFGQEIHWDFCSAVYKNEEFVVLIKNEAIELTIFLKLDDERY